VARCGRRNDRGLLSKKKKKRPGAFFFVLEGSYAPPDFPPTPKTPAVPPHLPIPYLLQTRREIGGQSGAARRGAASEQRLWSQPHQAPHRAPRLPGLSSAYPPPGPGPRAAWRARPPPPPTVRCASRPLHLFSPRNRCRFFF
jgi:hypothetical protein